MAGLNSSSWLVKTVLLAYVIPNLFQTGLCQNWVWDGKDSPASGPVKTGFSQFLVQKPTDRSNEPAFSTLISGPRTGLVQGRTNQDAGFSNGENGNTQQNSASFSSIFGVSPPNSKVRGGSTIISL